VKAFESQPVWVDHLAGKRASTAAIEMQVPLSSLVPGQYVCQLNVVDAGGKKYAVRRTPLILLP